MEAVMKAYVKTSNLLRTIAILSVAFTLFACPQSKQNGLLPDPNQPSDLDVITGSEKANESLKNTVWVYSENQGGPGQSNTCKLEFDSNTNICRIASQNLDFKFYVAEYSISEDKINLNLDKSVKAIEKYSATSILKDMKEGFEADILDDEELLKDPDVSKEEKEIIQKTVNAMKEALSKGMFTSLENFKKLMLEIVIPAQIEKLETLLKKPSISPQDKADMERSLQEMKGLLANPAKITLVIEEQVEEMRKQAKYLKSINPIILSLPQGQTLQTSTTMTANKVYIGVTDDTPEYKENIDFTRQ